MSWTARISALALAAGLLTTGASAGASAGRLSVPARPTHNGSAQRERMLPEAVDASPKGYQVVINAGLVAANGVETPGTAKCPAKTVVYGGGVVIDADSLAANINSSWPKGPRTWGVDVNNASGAATTFNVYAVCADKPTDYQQVKSPLEDNPSGHSNGSGVGCPTGTKVLGGGSFSTSSLTSVNENSSLPALLTHPKAYIWAVGMNNASAQDAEFYVAAVCGKVTGYKLKNGSSFTNPADSTTTATVSCPAGTVPLGGGVDSMSDSTAVNIASTAPGGSEWIAYENNGTGTKNSITPAMACAS